MNQAEVRAIWLKEAEEQAKLLQGRVAQDIETYRKGNCEIKLTDKAGNPLKNKEIKVNQTRHAFHYGANLFMLDEFPSREENERFRQEFHQYFNLATIPFYWNDLEPEQGNYRFDKDSPKRYRRPATDLCLEYCEKSGIDAKLHCLVYEKFLPKWLPKQDMKGMEQAYETHFSEIAKRYSGKLVEVEIINELLTYVPGWTERSVISDRRDIIPWAFQTARKYFKDDVLVINEANPLLRLSDMTYRSPYFMMVEHALSQGACIDKIGLQHHTFTGVATTTRDEYEQEVMKGAEAMFDPARLLKGLDVMGEFGLPLELTEITVPTFGETEEDEELQADLLDVLYTTCFSHPLTEGLVYWNVPDGYAYIQEGVLWNENKVRGGLFHHDMTPKRAAKRLYEMFHHRWRTEETLVTDDMGCARLRGFYGDYTIEMNGEKQAFALQKNSKTISICY